MRVLVTLNSFVTRILVPGSSFEGIIPSLQLGIFFEKKREKINV